MSLFSVPGAMKTFSLGLYVTGPDALSLTAIVNDIVRAKKIIKCSRTSLYRSCIGTVIWFVISDIRCYSSAKNQFKLIGDLTPAKYLGTKMH